MSSRTKKASGLIAVAAMAILVLTACINVTYKLTVNSDATLSGTLKAEISKQVMSTLGVTTKEQLGEGLTSGDMGIGVDEDLAQSCVESEDTTNFIITCTIENKQASEVDDAWSLTKTGDELTLRVVSEAQGASDEENLMPEIDLGKFSFTATFPGEISSITGTGATKVGSKTVQANGSLNDAMDFTVVASSEATDSSTNAWVFVILGIAVLAVIAIIVLVLRKPRKQAAPAKTADEVPPTADSSDPSI